MRHRIARRLFDLYESLGMFRGDKIMNNDNDSIPFGYLDSLIK